MATGILSVGLHAEGFLVASEALLVIAAIAYLLLVVLNVWRIVAYPREVVHDFRSPQVAFFFYTFVAGTNVLGTRLAVDGDTLPAAVLLGLSCLVWLVLGYAVPWAVILDRRGKETLSGMNGAWFVWAVACQSVAVLSATLEPELPPLRAFLSIIAFASWSVGIILYAIIGITVVVRLLVYGITPEGMGPPYWVAMGAASITVLAGSHVVEMKATAMTAVTTSLAAGGSVVFWSFATWLIPVLVAVGWWRHVTHKVPLRYEPALWSIVFPLGMYAVCGINLGEADALPVVAWTGRIFLWLALAAWLVVFIATCVHLVRSMRRTHVDDISRAPVDGA
ncbi:tellurite resistance protein permease [Humibacter ginsenosidimutans]|uniref:Tellurite resistance protein permease n=2 Tax=Humibacter ginsenosidimutans TaxID=2599293 RepID=A0A5B8M8N8_9MICO|nr:tellurite resistance protein permease [Humibacter ginsenosidimutans]